MLFFNRLGAVVAPRRASDPGWGVWPPAQKHVSRLLPGAETPASALTEVDKLPTVRMPGTGRAGPEGEASFFP